MVSDAASSGAQTEGLTAQQIWESAPQSVRDASAAEITTPLISDSASSGPQAEGLTAKQIWASAPQSERDASSAAMRDQAPSAGGGGIDISAPSPSTAGIAGGVALLIVGAGFSIRGQRRRAPRPT
jgi:MYXO-CTERM domain-containing protein